LSTISKVPKVITRSTESYASPLAPKYPPIPIEILPAKISAIPANTTIFVSPRAARPAVKANGTVKPSLNPSVASETVRGSICHLEDVEYAEENCEDDSEGDDSSFSELCALKVGRGAYEPELSFRNIDVIVLKDMFTGFCEI
jgi:hypothetical protein